MQVMYKVVKRLPVNRLPVKLPITGFNFQLPITDLPTFSASASSHRRTQANKGRTQTIHTVAARRTTRSRWFILTQRLTVESAPLPSPRRVTAAGKGGEGKRCELDGRRGLQRLRPRVLFAASFDLIVAACIARPPV